MCRGPSNTGGAFSTSWTAGKGDGLPGITLCRGGPQDHLALGKHLTAESKVEEFVAGKGVVVRWERVRRQNHWLDALYNACAAAHACGARVVAEQPPEPPPAPAQPERSYDVWDQERNGSWINRWRNRY